MEKRPLVTVVIPTYNQEKTVARAIDSVLAQETDFPFEIYLADDCGTDGSRALLMRYAARWPQLIRLHLRDRTVGLSRNWYEALCDARGEFVCLLDAGDWWTSPEKLQKQVDFLRTHPECLAVGHPQQLVDISGSSYGTYPAEPLCDQYITPELFLEGWNYSCTSCLVRNFFDPMDEKTHAFVTGSRGEAELPLSMLYLDRGPVYLMGEVLSARRVSSLNPGIPSCREPSESKRFATLLDVVERSRTYFEGRYDFDRLLLTKASEPVWGLICHGGLEPFLHQVHRLPLSLRMRLPLYSLRSLRGKKTGR